MMRRLGIVLAIALGAVLLSGSPRAGAASYSVTIANYAFSPANLSVRAGDKVTWTNTDTAPHDATTTSAPVAFHSPRLEKGQSWSYTFTTPGTYSYICSIHPDMHATVVVAAVPTTHPATHPATHAASHPPTHAPAPSTAGAPTEAAPSMQMPAGPGGTGSASSRATPSARHASHPAPTRSSARASGPAAPAVAPPASVVPAVAAASTTASLNPLLLVAGLVAAVATLCLLLLASRPGG